MDIVRPLFEIVERVGMIESIHEFVEVVIKSCLRSVVFRGVIIIKGFSRQAKMSSEHERRGLVTLKFSAALPLFRLSVVYVSSMHSTRLFVT